MTPRDAAPDLLAGEGHRRLRIAHLFPDLLGVYGDAGNIRTLAVRARARSIAVDVIPVPGDALRLPVADLFVIGGGQDRDQVDLERTLGQLGDDLGRQVARGASLLAVCAGYQSLGEFYRTSTGRVIRGPGILDLWTEAAPGRLVGPVVAALAPVIAEVAPGPGSLPRPTLVGFENHSGRTTLTAPARSLATVEAGHGNNDVDGKEGLIELPGWGGIEGLRIGTYLHGPLLPRNPHLADILLAAALRRTGQPADLAPLDDAAEWAAHDAFVAQCRTRDWTDRLPAALRRVVQPVSAMIGF